MGKEEIFLPLNPENLRSGEKITFNIYVKGDTSNAPGREYALFCRRGEMFKPGFIAQIKFRQIPWVYYHRQDQDSVEMYLNHDYSLIGNIQFLRLKRMRGAAIPKMVTYLPLAVKDLRPGLTLTFDIFLKSKVLSERDYEYNIFICSGDMVKKDHINELHQKKINKIYYPQQQEPQVFQYLYDNLSINLKDGKLTPKHKAEMIYNVALLWAARFYYEKHTRTLEELTVGFKLIDLFLPVMRQDRDYGLWLPRIFRHGAKLHIHCLNTCLLGLGFTQYLGWSRDVNLEFACGVLMHDLGMMEVGEEVLSKPGRLAPEELELIRSHPQFGCRLVREVYSSDTGKNYSPSQNFLELILEHHEAGDGSGYPLGLTLSQINPWARILRIIDSYDAMTSNRSWREKFHPVDALTEMRQAWQDRGVFDTNFLVEFIKFLSAS